jgi:uncharacterized protein (DUF305 family)
MYQNKRWNAISIAAGIVCFALIRQQTASGDRQFLRSMIPHHGGAILMCAKAPIQDRSIQELCQQIIASQRSGIDQMKMLLKR